MQPHTPPLPPRPLIIPQIPKLIVCHKCGYPFGPFRTHKGSTSLTHKGKIIQQCTNTTCHHVEYRTQPYPYEMAEQIVAELNKRTDLQSHPIPYAHSQPVQPFPVQVPLPQPPPAQMPAPTVTNPPIPNPSQPVTVQGSRYIFCSRCKFRNGSSARASRSCTLLLCPNCCDDDYWDAMRNGRFRDQCKSHGARSQIQRTSSTTPFAVTPGVRRNIKKINIGPGWQEESERAEKLTEERKDLKLRRRGIDEALARSVTTIIWYQDGKAPLILLQLVQTFPHYVLQDFPQDVELLQLTSTQRLDTYDPPSRTWVTHCLDTPQLVERDQRLLYRLRCGLDEVVSDCPGLDEEIKRQHGDDKRSAKRRLEEHVSPIKIESDTLDSSRICKKSQKRSEEDTPGGSKQNAICISDTESMAEDPGAGILSVSRGEGSVKALSNGERDWKAEILMKKKRKQVVSVKPSRDPLSRPSSQRTWPSEWTFKEITDGINKIMNDTRTRPEAFGDVFDQRYKSSTFYGVKALHDKASSKLKQHFEGYGKTRQGLWPHFVAALRNNEDASSSSDDSASLSDVEKQFEERFLRKPSEMVRDPTPGSSASASAEVCPYCEEKWPLNPSERSLQLRKEADLDRNSVSDPSPTCVYARRPCCGNMTAFALVAELCQNHTIDSQLESGHAHADKWPREIDFSSLPDRVKSFADELSEVVFDPSASEFFEDIKGQFETQNSVRACGLSGQWGRLDKVHAGYYGEKGRQIIIEALEEMYPLESENAEESDMIDTIDTSKIAPLTHDEFIEYVLAIEATILLIGADLHLESPKELQEVWAASRAYGCEKYPACDDDIQRHAIKQYTRRSSPGINIDKLISFDPVTTGNPVIVTDG